MLIGGSREVRSSRSPLHSPSPSAQSARYFCCPTHPPGVVTWHALFAEYVGLSSRACRWFGIRPLTRLGEETASPPCLLIL